MFTQGREGEGEIDFEDGFGMTAARQAEVRGALFNMLGSAEGGRSGASQPGASDAEERRGAVETSRLPQGHRQQSSGKGAGNGESWSCSVCTLINSADRVMCRACGCAHMSE